MRLEKELGGIMGTKDRSVEGYALIGMAVKYIFSNNQAVFESLGHPWEELMTQFLPGQFRDAVRMSHPQISRPDLILKNYLRDIAKLLANLTISDFRGVYLHVQYPKSFTTYFTKRKSSHSLKALPHTSHF